MNIASATLIFTSVDFLKLALYSLHWFAEFRCTLLNFNFESHNFFSIIYNFMMARISWKLYNLTNLFQRRVLRTRQRFEVFDCRVERGHRTGRLEPRPLELGHRRRPWGEEGHCSGRLPVSVGESGRRWSWETFESLLGLVQLGEIRRVLEQLPRHGCLGKDRSQSRLELRPRPGKTIR